MSARCPAGKFAVGAGGRINGGEGQVALQTIAEGAFWSSRTTAGGSEDLDGFGARAEHCRTGRRRSSTGGATGTTALTRSTSGQEAQNATTIRFHVLVRGLSLWAIPCMCSRLESRETDSTTPGLFAKAVPPVTPLPGSTTLP